METIQSRIFRPLGDWSKRDEMTRIVLSVLRTAHQPMTTREIGERLIVKRGLQASPALLDRMTRRVACALRRQRELGHARSSKGEAGFWQLWSSCGKEH